jgi:hypothetical protein
MKPATWENEISPISQLSKTQFARLPLKRQLALAVVVAFMVCGITSAHANDLYNGDLDILGAKGANGQNNAGPDGWKIEANKTLSGPNLDGADSEPWCNVQQEGGYGLFFKPFGGSTNEGLNDYITVYFYQDNPCSPGTKCTLSGYAAGEANYSGFIPGPTKTLFVVEFLDSTSAVVASNAYDLVVAGLPNGGPGSMAIFTTPEYTAPANTTTVRAGAFMIDAYSTAGSQSFFVDAFDLESVAPPGSPVITNQPVSVTAGLGGTASITVGVADTNGVSFQWQLFGADLTNSAGHISGATSQTLTISGISTNDIGRYRVRLSNGIGSVFSREAALAIVGINFFPVVTINGRIGDTYEVDYATALAPTTWISFSTNVLTMSPEYVIDPSSPGANSRFYRAVFLH